MGKRNAKGILLIGRMPQSGVTIYEKQGKTVVRTAHNSSKPRRCTLKQFIQRQRMRHSIALWHELLCCDPMFTEHQSAYSGFVALANRLPAVFVDKSLADCHLNFSPFVTILWRNIKTSIIMGTMIYAIGIGIVFEIFKYLEDKNDWRSWTLEWRLWDMIFKNCIENKEKIG